MDEKLPPSPESAERSPGSLVQSSFIKPQFRKLHDPDVTWEEYNYYAQRTREYERQLESPKLNWRTLLDRKNKDGTNEVVETEGNGHPAAMDLNLSKEENRMQISDQEWVNASRAFRTAGWGACFYLVHNTIYRTACDAC